MDNQRIVSNIKDICSKKNYSIMQLEDDINVSHGLISRWSKPNGNPPLEKIIEISRLLNVSIVDIIGEEQNKETNNKQNGSDNKVIDENLLLIENIYDMKWRVYDYNNMCIEQFDNAIKEFYDDVGCIGIEPYFLKIDDSYILLLVGYINYKPILALYTLENTNILIEKEEDISSDSLVDLWKHIRSSKGILSKISKVKNKDLKRRIILKNIV